ncbi:MAG: hypothetical protein ABMA02_02965 [Saprospiraceae bacterium]
MRTISLLNLLSQAELTSLGKYLKSPFFTEKPYLHSLFDKLRQAGQSVAEWPDYRRARLFPKGTFTGKKWNNALSDLNACIEEFLVVNHLLADRDLYNQALVKAYSERLNDPVLQRSVSTIIERVSGKEAPEQMDTWHLRFWSRKRALTHPLTNRIKLGVATIDALEQDLDTYYYISKTQLMCNRVSGIKLFGWPTEQDAPMQWLETVRRAANENPSPLLKVYCDLLGLLLGAGVDLPAFFTTLRHHAPRLHRDELQDIVRMAFNACIYRQRKGEKGTFDWHLAIYNWSIGQGLGAGPQAEEEYLNIGVLLAKSHRHAEFENHMNVGKEIIPADRLEQAKTLLKACWEFSQGNYSDAQVKISQITSRHLRYTLSRHSLAVRNSYMLFLDGAINLSVVKHALDSFDEFLKNKSLFSDSFRQSHQGLIWFVREFIQPDTVQKKSKKYLLQEINIRQPANSDWVMAVLDRLPD